MLNAKLSFSNLLISGLTAAALAAVSVPMFAQDSAKGGGYVDDWSTHHAVFTNPGPELDALKGSHYDQWLKVVGDPRYVMQQQKRGSTALQPTLVPSQGFQNTFGPRNTFGAGRRFGNPGGIEGRERTSVKLDKDWSMNGGSLPTASLTINVSSAPGAGTVSGTSTVTVDGQTFTGSAPVAAKQTGTFSGNPTSGQTVTVGGTEVLSASDSTAATASVTVGASTCFPTNSGISVDGTTITTTAGEGTGTYTVTGTGPTNTETIVIGGVTYTFETTLTGAPTNSVLIGSTIDNTARNLSVAIAGGTGTCGNGAPCTNATVVNPLVTSTNTGAVASETMTAKCGNNAVITNTGNTNMTVGNVAVGTVGTTSAAARTIALGTVAGTNVNTTIAANINTVINGNATLDVAFASTVASNVVNISVDAWGTGGNADTLAVSGAPTGLTLSGATFAGGTDGTNTGTSFAIVNVPATDATNLAAAITRNVGALGITASSAAAVVTVTEATPGTGGNGATSLATTAAGFAWTAGTTAGGTDGTNSTNSFKYWTVSAYDTQAQLATDLATAFADNATLTPVISATANTGATPPNVVLTAFQGGAAGNAFTATDTTFTALTLGNGGDFAGGTSGVLANTFPAKYSFSTTTESCSDYVVFPTGVGATNATVIAYNNIYATTCTGTVPTVAWAYNTGGTSILSPVISFDGKQVAYIQSSSNIASLVILKPSATSGGTAGSPATINLVSLGSYRACTAPCYTTITLSGSPNDANSSPYYNYNTVGGDNLWVGDDSGKLHQFTGVFLGTPAEMTTNWPVTVDSGATLTSPVWESISGNVFVGDSKGKLSYVSPSATPAVTSSAVLSNAASLGIVDAPLIDEAPATPLVYAFVGDSAANTALVEQFSTSFASGAAAAATSEVSSGSGSGTGSVLYAGTFDNIHYDIGGTGGFMWVCGGHMTFADPELVRISMAAFATAGVQEDAITSGAGVCSPVTEFLGTKAGTSITTLTNTIPTAGAVTVTVGSTTGLAINDLIQIDSEIMLVATVPTGTTFTVAAGGRGEEGTTAATHLTTGVPVQDIQDWAYLSVSATGADTGCTGACLYNYSVTTTTSPTGSTTGIAATGGTSGVIIDNALTGTGESQIYYSTLANQSCTGTVVTGTGTGSCAVQTSQSAP